MNRPVFRSSRRGLYAALAAMLFAGADNGDRGSISPKGNRSGAPVLSCGTLSLTTLLRLETGAGTPEQVATHLPETSEHSLADLRNAAREFGVPLRGVRIRLDDWPLDRPALVKFNREESGHFVVVRSVGHNGRLMQIIDPTHGVSVQDADQVFRSRAWTGLALVPARGLDDRPLRFILAIGFFINDDFFIKSRGD